MRGLSGHSLLWLRSLGMVTSVSGVTCDQGIVITILSVTHLHRSLLTLLRNGQVYANNIVCEAKFVTLSLKPCVCGVMKLPSTLLQNFAPFGKNKNNQTYGTTLSSSVKYKVVGIRYSVQVFYLYFHLATLTYSPKCYGLLITFSQIMSDSPRLLLSLSTW